MKTITVSKRSRVLNYLLKEARYKNILLQFPNGQHFILAFIENWQSFDVGVGDNFSDEVRRTSKNKKFMKFLTERHYMRSKRIPLSKVKEELGFKQK